MGSSNFLLWRGNSSMEVVKSEVAVEGGGALVDGVDHGSAGPELSATSTRSTQGVHEEAAAEVVALFAAPVPASVLCPSPLPRLEALPWAAGQDNT